ncbi:hypothetical protein OG777_11155 [Micromonospora peucetia]|uniref:Uncharacterized protein n=1 Tax=Micromonospora peucetia TaxID=47871 RepID=A0A1C6UTS7_9ACTN|nr:hypothetical protein [Micromonospora peucetia]MCX4387487.1 hypothetical protein [Micromonospora peucetia]WSA34810.1 hypothetical protein OIE14_12575 [Micromonospora peucetia]SCL57427.1 hypothetical protein GA0070608_1820 [Micromonospora peucetia]
MANILRHPRVRGAITVGAVAGGLVLTMATPAQADYNSPLYSTLKACNAARPSYVSSWTSPQACYPMYNWNGTKRIGYSFLVKTRY